MPLKIISNVLFLGLNMNGFTLQISNDLVLVSQSIFLALVYANIKSFDLILDVLLSSLSEIENSIYI